MEVHRPEYCAFYVYPLLIGYTFPLLPLAEEFCRFYNVYPVQLSPYLYKAFLMLTKYAELAGCEVDVRYSLHLFSPSFYRDTMTHPRHRGTRGLVVRMDDRTNRKFWNKNFFIKTEHLVADPSGFPEQWNYDHKCLCRTLVVFLRPFIFSSLAFCLCFS